MAHFGKVIQGVLAFFTGLFITFVSWYFIPPLINFIDDPVVRAIGWVGLIGFWVLSVIVYPSYLVVSGMSE